MSIDGMGVTSAFWAGSFLLTEERAGVLDDSRHHCQNRSLLKAAFGSPRCISLNFRPRHRFFQAYATQRNPGKGEGRFAKTWLPDNCGVHYIVRCAGRHNVTKYTLSD